MTEQQREPTPAPKPGKSENARIRDEVQVRLVRADTSKENTHAAG